MIISNFICNVQQILIKITKLNTDLFDDLKMYNNIKKNRFRELVTLKSYNNTFLSRTKITSIMINFNYIEIILNIMEIMFLKFLKNIGDVLDICSLVPLGKRGIVNTFFNFYIKGGTAYYYYFGINDDNNNFSDVDVGQKILYGCDDHINYIIKNI